MENIEYYKHVLERHPIMEIFQSFSQNTEVTLAYFYSHYTEEILEGCGLYTEEFYIKTISDILMFNYNREMAQTGSFDKECKENDLNKIISIQLFKSLTRIFFPIISESTILNIYDLNYIQPQNYNPIKSRSNHQIEYNNWMVDILVNVIFNLYLKIKNKDNITEKSFDYIFYLIDGILDDDTEIDSVDHIAVLLLRSFLDKSRIQFKYKNVGDCVEPVNGESCPIYIDDETANIVKRIIKNIKFTNYDIKEKSLWDYIKELNPFKKNK